jgi:hypothetical protein
MQQARARFQRGHELDESHALDVEMDAASALGYEGASSRRRFVALEGGAAAEAISRFETADFDDALLGDVPPRTHAGRPTTRTRPRRPTGAAADYARGARDGRRTIEIRGRGAQTALRPTPSELRGPRPDRVAGWAFGFAVFVAILAAVTGG